MRRHVVAVSLIVSCTLAIANIAHAQDPSVLIVNEFMASNSTTLADGDGDYSDWVEIYNPGGSAVSLNGCYLTDNPSSLTKWQFPAAANITVPAGGYIIVFASDKGVSGTYVDSTGRIHTNYKLSAGGESVLLVNTDGTTIISSFINFPAQGTDVSYGRGANAVDGYFRTPTPGAANGDAGDGFVEDTKFSVDRGIFTSAFNLEITTATAGATIRYTLDGTTPSETVGTVYTGPIAISTSTPVRAMAYKAGWFSTNVDTQTYLFLSSAINQPATRPSAAWPTPVAVPGGGTTQAYDYGMDTRVTTDPRYVDMMDDALTDVPSISIVTDLPNLFDASTGIYANPDGDGDAWERPASVELIYPDGTEGFQVNTGLRIRGGVSRAKSNPKHSFRIVMRSDYGNSKINFPLFGPTGAQEFDKLDFRTAQNQSWNFNQPQYATFLDDPFTRVTMRDMGQPYTRGFWFHMYINGVYWGMYQTEERPDAHYAASYLNAPDDEDYDVVKADSDTGAMYATDGTMDHYNAFWSLVTAGVTTQAQYERLLGRNEDGSANPAYVHYLDDDNLIDYMLVVFFTGAPDMPLGPPNSNSRPRNLYAIVNRIASEGWKYITHDNEGSMAQNEGVNKNRVSASLPAQLAQQQNFNPWWLHSKLKANSEYLITFADRVHKHFFNGGALTPEANLARYQALMDEISIAIIAESARWGDTLRPTAPRTRDDDWVPATNWVKNNYLNASPSTRTEIVLQQLKAAGLYPTVDAPEYNQFGGSVPMGFNVVVTAPAGTIYYTTDGSDPRLIGGAVNGTAQSGASGLTVLINATTQVKARARNGTTWSAITDATFTAIAPTSTPTPSPTPSPSPSATATASPTLSPTPTATPTATPSPSPFPTQDPDVGDAWVVS